MQLRNLLNLKRIGIKNDAKQILSRLNKTKNHHSRLNAQNSKKPPHRTFDSSKKPGKTDWDDSAKLEALNKNPQKRNRKYILSWEWWFINYKQWIFRWKFSILSTGFGSSKEEKSDESKSQKSIKQFKKKKETTSKTEKAMELKLRKGKTSKAWDDNSSEDNLTVQN